MGQVTVPLPSAREKGGQGKERGKHTAQPQHNPCVNEGHGARRKWKHTALRNAQNGLQKRHTVKDREQKISMGSEVIQT